MRISKAILRQCIIHSWSKRITGKNAERHEEQCNNSCVCPDEIGISFDVHDPNCALRSVKVLAFPDCKAKSDHEVILHSVVPCSVVTRTTCNIIDPLIEGGIDEFVGTGSKTRYVVVISAVLEFDWLVVVVLKVTVNLGSETSEVLSFVMNVSSDWGFQPSNLLRDEASSPERGAKLNSGLSPAIEESFVPIKHLV